MKRTDAIGVLATLALPLGVPAATFAADSPTPAGTQHAADVVEREVAAYNAHDAATVAKMHAADATFTLLPQGKILAQGYDQLVGFFTKNFADNPNAHLTIEAQFVFKNVVVNHYTTGKGSGILSIYEVANSVIANEWLIVG